MSEAYKNHQARKKRIRDRKIRNVVISIGLLAISATVVYGFIALWWIVAPITN